MKEWPTLSPRKTNSSPRAPSSGAAPPPWAPSIVSITGEDVKPSVKIRSPSVFPLMNRDATKPIGDDSNMEWKNSSNCALDIMEGGQTGEGMDESRILFPISSNGVSTETTYPARISKENKTSGGERVNSWAGTGYLIAKQDSANEKSADAKSMGGMAAGNKKVPVERPTFPESTPTSIENGITLVDKSGPLQEKHDASDSVQVEPVEYNSIGHSIDFKNKDIGIMKTKYRSIPVFNKCLPTSSLAKSELQAIKSFSKYLTSPVTDEINVSKVEAGPDLKDCVTPAFSSVQSFETGRPDCDSRSGGQGWKIYVSWEPEPNESGHSAASSVNGAHGDVFVASNIPVQDGVSQGQAVENVGDSSFGSSLSDECEGCSEYSEGKYALGADMADQENSESGHNHWAEHTSNNTSSRQYHSNQPVENICTPPPFPTASIPILPDYERKQVYIPSPVGFYGRDGVFFPLSNGFDPASIYSPLQFESSMQTRSTQSMATVTGVIPFVPMQPCEPTPFYVPCGPGNMYHIYWIMRDPCAELCYLPGPPRPASPTVHMGPLGPYGCMSPPGQTMGM